MPDAGERFRFGRWTLNTDRRELVDEAGVATPLFAPDGARGDPRFAAEIDRWLTSEQLSIEQCRANMLPGMVWREEPRDLLVTPKDAQVGSPADDERNRGAAKVELSFSLPRGVYATMLIKHLLAPTAPLDGRSPPTRRRQDSKTNRPS